MLFCKDFDIIKPHIPSNQIKKIQKIAKKPLKKLDK
jgi:hypothetical protein